MSRAARQETLAASQGAADGQLKAAAALSRTILHRDVRRVIDDYKRLDSEEAKARYADHFLSRAAGAMDEIWPTFYELLKCVKEGELFSKPGYLGGDRTFDTFKEYFEHRVGRPFETWAELEGTYHYAEKYAPDLLRKAFSIARGAKERATQGARAIAQAIKDGLILNEGRGPLTAEEQANGHIMSIKAQGSHGTNAEYLMRRIARDRPDVLDRKARPGRPQENPVS